jgi:hypothetical protein
MFAALLNLLRDELNAFISQKKGADAIYVAIANLNNISENTQSADNKIIASIVAIDEEKTLKTPENFIRSNHEITYKQPTLWLNVCIMFTFFTRSAENYDGLDLLGNVMQYFQSKPILTSNNVIDQANFPQNIDKIRSELMSLNFDQSNNLWSLFGGRYHPSVLYKFKSIAIDNQDITPGGPPILTTEVEAIHKNN